MATVKERIEADIASLQAQLAALPEEVHHMEESVWQKIRDFFHRLPQAAAPTSTTPQG